MRGQKVMYLKVRIVLLRKMTKGEAIKKLERTVRTGIVQEGIEVAWINWKKGEGYHSRSGDYLRGKAADALVDFVNVIMSSPQRRIAIIAPGER